jgi:transcriptional regulator with XRE-family HTH domain
MALEFEGDLFDGDRGKVMKGILRKPRKNAAAPKPRKKKEPDVEPLLSKAPYKQRIKDLLLATGWTLQDEDFLEKFGFSAATVYRRMQGRLPATVLFVRRLVRLEGMYENELKAVHAGLIKMAPPRRGERPVRLDLRRVKAVVEDGKRGL